MTNPAIDMGARPESCRVCCARFFAPVLLALSLFLLPLWLRCGIEAARNLAQARAAFAANDYAPAFDAYRRAIGWDAPLLGNPKTAAREALARVETLDSSIRLDALWQIRSGLFSARSLLWDLGLHPYPALLADVDGRIAQLANPENKPQITETYAPHSNRVFQLLANIFFWSWIAAMLLLIVRGFGPDGSRRPGMLKYAAAAGLCYLLWLSALWFA